MDRYSSINFNAWRDSDVMTACLEIDQDWGFVIFRTSYGSQEKWDYFISNVRERLHHHIATDVQYGRFELATEVEAMLKLTIFEDAATLDGVDINETARLFMDWSNRQQEDLTKGNDTSLEDDFSSIPRYHAYIHADQLMLNSIYQDSQDLDAVDEDDGTQWKSGKNHIFLVDCRDLFKQARMDGEYGEDQEDEGRVTRIRVWGDAGEGDEWDEEPNGWESAWRVRGVTIMDLYVNLLDGREWCRCEEEGFYKIDSEAIVM